MSLRVSFELDENDLKHFRLIMRDARKAAARKAPEDIVASAEQLLVHLGNDDTPGFVVERLGKIKLMIRMISDLEWRLPHEETNRVLNALAYFSEPEDLIPDDIPGLGFLDDAIMIELVVRELKHEIDAYEDFCTYRQKAREQDTGQAVSREAWLDSRRSDLQTRMRRRRKRALQRATSAAKLGLFD